nr:pre-mRNA 3'-end-processing factor FIP1 isoform X6 [Danio rerio]|eukprot:XP_021329037.1 pre-mRNA 3'-end-processing factor FIP1 isoform X6 [Danio rerio]
MGARDTEKALEEKDQEIDIEKEDTENKMNTDPHAAAVGGVMIVMTQKATGDTDTNAPDTAEETSSPARSAAPTRRTSRRPLNESLASW